MAKFWQTGFPLTQMQAAMTGHLYVEERINMILSIVFKNDDIFRKFSYSQKLDVLRASDILPPVSYNRLKALGNLRNSFAHNLMYDVTVKDLQKIDTKFKESDWRKEKITALTRAIAGICGVVEMHLIIVAEYKKEGYIVL